MGNQASCANTKIRVNLVLMTGLILVHVGAATSAKEAGPTATAISFIVNGVLVRLQFVLVEMGVFSDAFGKVIDVPWASKELILSVQDQIGLS